MRIAIIQRSLPSKSGGGVAHQVHYLANTLVRLGHDITIYTFDPTPKDALYNVVKLELDISRSRLMRTYSPPIYFATQDFSSFDIIHAHGDDQFIRVKNPKVRYVRTFHGSSLAEAMHSSTLTGVIYHLSIYPFEIISTLSANIRTAVSRFSAKYIPFVDRVIPNGVDFSLFKPEFDKSKEPTVLFVGTLRGRKRGRLIMDAFKVVEERVKSAKLWMVCDDVKNGIGNKNIKFFHRLPADELAQLYKKAWVFCLPSTYEGFGIPYIEAMACGTPVVATPNGGAEEVLDKGKFGFIVKDEELANTIIKLLKDEILREKITRKALKHVQNFSILKVARMYLDAYYSL